MLLSWEEREAHLVGRPYNGARREALVGQYGNFFSSFSCPLRCVIDLHPLQAVYQVTVLLVLYYDGINLLNLQSLEYATAERIRNTVIFNAFVMCQVCPQ